MSESDQAEEWERQKEAWAFAVGKFMLAFGDVEYFVDRCLIDIPVVNAYYDAKTLPFKARASTAIGVVGERLAAHPSRSPLVNAINRAINLAKERDVIAHNPLHLGLYEDDEGLLEYQLQISPLRNQSVCFTLDDIHRLIATAEALVADLFERHRAATAVISD